MGLFTVKNDEKNTLYTHNNYDTIFKVAPYEATLVTPPGRDREK